MIKFLKTLVVKVIPWLKGVIKVEEAIREAEGKEKVQE